MLYSLSLSLTARTAAQRLQKKETIFMNYLQPPRPKIDWQLINLRLPVYVNINTFILVPLHTLLESASDFGFLLKRSVVRELFGLCNYLL